MRTLIFAAPILCGLLLVEAVLAQAPDSSLLGYTKCVYSGGLVATNVDRVAQRPMRRPVETAAGLMAVEVTDGYRIMLGFPNTDPFVNLKFELSVAERYAIDKRTVLDGMQQIADGSNGVIKLQQTTLRGLDVAALNVPGFDSNILGFYTIFDDDKSLIATAYVLNQVPERRAFQTVAEYQSLRDRFVDELTACMGRIAAAR